MIQIAFGARVYGESMSKLKVNQKQDQTNIRYKLNKRQTVNSAALQLFSTKWIRGFMRPVLEGRCIVYTAPTGITLKKFLQSGISKNDFFIAFAQIIEVLKKVERYALNMACLLMNTEYVFINQKTKELHFVYQPLDEPERPSNIFTFLYDVLSLTVLNLDEDSRFLNELSAFLHQQSFFSTESAEAYLLQVYPQVYQQVKREVKGQSQALQNRQWKTQGETEDTALLEESDDQTALLTQADMCEETALLSDQEGTVLLNSAAVHYPYLLRTADFDQVDVDKPLFRIGKEKACVDYFVSGNNAVSRVHADIVTESGRYFIQDHHSTNGTFVNGAPIPADQPVEIYDGDAIMLANEAFEFHIDVQ